MFESPDQSYGWSTPTLRHPELMEVESSRASHLGIFWEQQNLAKKGLGMVLGGRLAVAKKPMSCCTRLRSCRLSGLSGYFMQTPSELGHAHCVCSTGCTRRIINEKCGDSESVDR